MEITLEKRSAVWKEFLARWPKEKVESLTLEEYIDVKNHDTFAYWLEHKTKDIGSIRGGDASKFGIYRRNKPPKGQRPHIKHGEEYSWVKRFGDTEESVFKTIKSHILKVIQYIEAGDVKAIQEIDLPDTLKWKIAFLYQDADDPKVINIFKRDMLREACSDPTGDFFDLYKSLLEERGDKDIVNYGYEIWSALEKEESDDSDNNEHNQAPLDGARILNSLNTILYGPPGTGKTYNTINKALKIVDPDFYQLHQGSRFELKTRFDELVASNRIGFVTFHQSFSYEDFVEGLKANTVDRQVNYAIEDGIFKRMCDAAMAKPIMNQDQSRVDIAGRKVWKMSLGDTQGDDAYIYKQCIDNNYVLLGYGYNVDFSSAKDRAGVIKAYQSDGFKIDNESTDYRVTSVQNFKNMMTTGDLIVVSDGNQKFRAIAEVTGDYKFDPDAVDDHYSQRRKVIWHRVYEPSLPIDELLNKNLSQMTLYRLREPTIELSKLQALLELPEGGADSKATAHTDKRVLIIDEINRGNISNIFGELITLIEPSKRAGRSESLTVKLPYSKETFSVPSNLHIIGTMNTADKSLAQVDIALRRRFEFVEMMPQHKLLSGIDVEGIDIAELLKTINQRIELLYDREHTIGHSFFLPLQDDPSIDRLARIFALEVLPLLEEYFFEDWERVGQVLGDHLKSDDDLKFIEEKFDDASVLSLMGSDWSQEGIRPYQRNSEALRNAEAYIGIYEPF